MKLLFSFVACIGISTGLALAEVPEYLGSGLMPSLSQDGRYVAFQSNSSILVPDDTNQVTDVFVLDRTSGQTNRVSVAADGTQGNSESYYPVISSDGRFVAFASAASNLVAGDTNGRIDVFVYSLAAKEIRRVSVRSDGTEGNGGGPPRISGDGRYIAFAASDSNLLGGASSTPVSGIFVHDRETGKTELASLRSDGEPAGGVTGFDGFSVRCDFAISGDGRFVAFVSSSPDVVGGDTNTHADVFLYDRQEKSTTRVSVATGGGEAIGPSQEPALSAHGRFVAFTSLASNLADDDDNNSFDVFLHDRETKLTRLVSRSTNGTVGNGSSRYPSISQDGRLVAFASAATDLDSPWTYSLGVPNQLYVRDLVLERTILASTSGGGCSDFASGVIAPMISGNGRYVAFDTARQFSMYLVDLSGSRSRVFAHYANGEAGGLPNRTRLILRNPGNLEDHGQIRFRDKDGHPSPTLIGGESVASVDYALAPWGTFELQTDGTGALAAGSIEVTTSLGAFSVVKGTEVFEVLGHFVSLDECPVRLNQQIYASVDSQERTGLALYNPGDREVTNIRLELRDNGGWQRATVTLSRLRPNQQWAIFVDELFLNYFPSHPEDFEGTVEIQAGFGIAAAGLIQKRQTGALVAVPTSVFGWGTQHCPAPVAPSPTLIFPQFADGQVLQQPNRTRLILRNNSSEADEGQVLFQDKDGEPATVVIKGQAANPVPYDLQNWGVASIATDGSGDLDTGSVEVRSQREADSRLEGAEVFEILGNYVSVFNCPPRRSHQVYTSVTDDENTGVALYNPGPLAATLDIFLVNDAGTEIASRQITLEKGQQIAVFVNEQLLFQSFFEQMSMVSFHGTVNILARSDGQVSALGLIQHRATGALMSIPAGPEAFRR